MRDIYRQTVYIILKSSWKVFAGLALLCVSFDCAFINNSLLFSRLRLRT